MLSRTYLSSESPICKALLPIMEGQGSLCSVGVPREDDGHRWLGVLGGGGWTVDHHPFHHLLVESLGIQTVQSTPMVLVAKVFDKKFGDQTLLGFDVRGTGDGNLGAEVSTGFATRFDHSGRYQGLFNNQLKDYLLGIAYRGWVSFSLGRDGGVINVAHGLPLLGMFCSLKGVKTSLAEWWTCPTSLLESWSVAVLVSKWPFPLQHEAGGPFSVEISPQMRKHFHFLQPLGSEGGRVLTRATAVGVATAWSQRLGVACERATRIAERVQFSEKQFRGDVLQQVQRSLQELEPSSLFGRESV